METPIPLAYWQAMIAVVDGGGYAQAAEALGRSQSSVSYAIQRLEDGLGVRVFRQQGRRAVPTEAGQLLLQRARLLLEHAQSLTRAGAQLAAGQESVLRLAVDALFPDALLLRALDLFARSARTPRVDVLETVLSGTEDALMRRAVDVAIAPRVPPGFVGEALMPMRFVAVAAPAHPLHQVEHALHWADLRPYRQLVIRDSGSQRENAGWLDAEQRWTFSHVGTSIRAACEGLGFAWYPELRIQDELADGRLKPLALAEGLYRHAWLYRIFTRPEFPGPASQMLDGCLARVIKDAGIEAVPFGAASIAYPAKRPMKED